MRINRMSKSGKSMESFGPPRWTWWPIPRRYLLSILGFFGFIHVYLLRVNMSFAIVAMTKNHSITDENGTVTYVILINNINLLSLHILKHFSYWNEYDIIQMKDFEWNSKERGLILSSFFYGYITTQILGGILAPIVGSGRLVCIGIFGTAILALATPSVAIAGGQIPLMVIRILQGICQGI